METERDSYICIELLFWYFHRIVVASTFVAQVLRKFLEDFVNVPSSINQLLSELELIKQCAMPNDRERFEQDLQSVKALLRQAGLGQRSSAFTKFTSRAKVARYNDLFMKWIEDLHNARILMTHSHMCHGQLGPCIRPLIEGLQTDCDIQSC